MSRKPLVAGNWKMHGTPDEARRLLDALLPRLSAIHDRQIVVFPPYTSLSAASAAIGDGPVELGAQNVHWEAEGAFTGEISAGMLLASGCRWALVGHSERRQFFGDTDDSVNRRARAALRAGLRVMICVGEKLEEREEGKTRDVVARQVRSALLDVDPAAMSEVSIAYEPVWAIGTGKTATPGQAQEVHATIRGFVAQLQNRATAEAVRILYGGSVKPGSIDALMAEPDIDGALVGGASLDADSFVRIATFQET